MKNNIVFVCSSVLTLFALVGNGFAEEAKPDLRPLVSIQEKKFEDLRPNAEKARYNNLKPLVEMVKHELFETGLRVVDEADMADAMHELEKLVVADGMHGEKASEGKLYIPAYYLKLKVLSYGFTSVVQKNPMSGNTTERKYLNAQMTASVVYVPSAEMVGSANIKVGPIEMKTQQGETSSQNGNFDEQMLQTLNQECARQIIEYLVKKMPEKFRPEGAEGKVVKVDGDRIVVKIKGDRFNMGDMLDVFRLEKIEDDDEEEDEDGDDEELVDEVYVGSVTVDEVKKKMVVCTPVALKGKIEKGMLARPSSKFKTPHSPQLPPKPDPSVPF